MYFKSRLWFFFLKHQLKLIVIPLLCYLSSAEPVKSEVSSETLTEGSIEIYVRIALAIALVIMTHTVSKYVFNGHPAAILIYVPALLIGILVSMVHLDTYKYIAISLTIGYLRTTGLGRTYSIVEGVFSFTPIGRSMCSRVNPKMIKQS